MKDFKTLLNEVPSKKMVIGFGRFNPPTTGHELLINKVTQYARSKGSPSKIYVTATEDKKKNPLLYRDKLKYAKNAFNLQPIDTNWRSTSRLAFRLYENNQKEEMYLLIDGILDAIDFPAPLLALIAYDKLRSGEEKLAKDYLLRAKKQGCTKKALGQAIYVKTFVRKRLVL